MTPTSGPGGSRRLRNRAVLALLSLALLTAAIAAGVVVQSRGGPPLFGFLFEPTGWGIDFSVVPYSTSAPYWHAFLVGLGNTVIAGLICICLASSLGLLLGLGRLSGNMLLSDLVKLYVDTIRNIPLILQAMFWYTTMLQFPPVRSAFELFGGVFLSNRGLFIPKLADGSTALGFTIALVVAVIAARALRRRLLDRSRGLSAVGVPAVTLLLALAVVVSLAPRVTSAFVLQWPELAGLNFKGGWLVPPEFVALIAAITIYRSAFISEVFRGGLQSISPGQIDAAKSLGLRPWVTLVKIRIPLALISIVPPMSSEYIVIMKVTSIGILIGFMDLFAVASMSSMMTGRTIEVLLIMVLVYIALNYTIATLMNAFNRRIRLRGFRDNA